MIFYQIALTGNYKCFGGLARAYSKKIFPTKKLAQDYIPSFMEKVLKDDGLMEWSPEKIQSKIVELECDDANLR